MGWLATERGAPLEGLFIDHGETYGTVTTRRVQEYAARLRELQEAQKRERARLREWGGASDLLI